jgi:phosphoribosyl 1,2-cyclic phosphodiesterase
MRVCVLSSGSKGNCTYIETSTNKILIDIGTNCRYVETALSKIGVDACDIDSVFITHSHVDHIAGIKVFSKKYKPNIYATEKIYTK